MPPAARSPSSAARVVYAGILASTLIVSSGALVVSLSLGSMTAALAPLDAVVFLVGMGALLAAFRQRQRLGGSTRGETVESWWGENGGKALLVWGLLELGALIGAMLIFATGRFPIYAVLATVALSGLVVSSPGRLVRGEMGRRSRLPS